jgi:hypothetical protein
LEDLTSEEEGKTRNPARAAVGESTARRARRGRAAVLIHRARVAAVATASGVLSHPAAHRISTAVIAINLVNRVNGTATWQVAHHSTIAAVISLGLGGNCKSKDGED